MFALSKIRTLSVTGVVYGMIGLWVLSILSLLGFLVWGYAAHLVTLPIVLWYAAALSIVALVNLCTAKPTDRPLAWGQFVGALLCVAIYAGAILHPSDEMRAAMEAR